MTNAHIALRIDKVNLANHYQTDALSLHLPADKSEAVLQRALNKVFPVRKFIDDAENKFVKGLEQKFIQRVRELARENGYSNIHEVDRATLDYQQFT